MIEQITDNQTLENLLYQSQKNEDKFAEGEIRCDKCGSFADQENGVIKCQLGCSS